MSIWQNIFILLCYSRRFCDETKMALLPPGIYWGRLFKNLPHKAWCMHQPVTSTSGRFSEMKLSGFTSGFLSQNLLFNMVLWWFLNTLNVRNTPQNNLPLGFFHLSSNSLPSLCLGVILTFSFGLLLPQREDLRLLIAFLANLAAVSFLFLMQ